MDHSWKAYYEKHPWDLTERLHIVRRNWKGRTEVLMPPSVKVYDQNMLVDSSDRAFLETGFGAEQNGDARGFMQAVLDTAWEQGLRPTGFTDVKNETAAIRYHLEDMRRLVFKTDMLPDKLDNPPVE